MMNRKKVVNRESLSERSTSILMGYRMGYRVMATLAPHFIHISVSGVIEVPQLEQKPVPLIGLAPQLGQISGVPINSLPQLLQNI
jgi:hypothetical protein